MPRTTIGGDDPGHDLSKQEKDRLERQLREEARDRRSGKPKDARRKLNRAINISRLPSQRPNTTKARMPDAISEYRTLLTAEESIHSLDRALALIVAIAAARNGPRDSRWHRLLNEREYTRRRMIQRSDRPNSVRVEDTCWAIDEIASNLIDSQEQIPESQFSLLMDTLLLVFHHAYFALLPKISAHRKKLLSAFTQFATILPRPQDQFQVRGLIQLEEGADDAAIKSFQAAIAATHSDEHDFITRVQMAWSVLMDKGLYIGAFECLADVYPRAARSDLSEISSLLRLTLLEVMRRGSPRPSAGQARKRA